MVGVSGAVAPAGVRVHVSRGQSPLLRGALASGIRCEGRYASPRHVHQQPARAAVRRTDEHELSRCPPSLGGDPVLQPPARRPPDARASGRHGARVATELRRLSLALHARAAARGVQGMTPTTTTAPFTRFAPPLTASTPELSVVMPCL